MKKVIKIVVLIILILWILSRMYYFVVINKVYHAIENFRNEENRYCSVMIIIQEQESNKREIFVKDNTVKRINKNDNVDIYCEWKDFNNDQEYSIDLRNKNYNENELEIQSNLLINLPNLILDIYKNNKFNLNQFLKIKYIIPIEYNKQKCYKIVTGLETTIVNRVTYLPIYSSIEFINSNKNSKDITENIYEFKIGEVTDEDIALPDLTGYVNMSEKEIK